MANLNNDSNSINCTVMGPAKNKIFTPVGGVFVSTFVPFTIPVICFLGLVGNIISFTIMKETGKKVSSHFYIKILTIFDCLSLIFFLPAGWLNLMMRPFYYHYQPGQFTWVDDFALLPYICEIRLYLTFVTRTISIHTIVAFTMERGIMVIWPYRGQRWCNMKNAKITVFALVVFSLLINLFCLFSFDRNLIPCSGGRNACKVNSLFFQYRTMEFMILSVIPSIIILLTNIGIIITLKKRREASYIASEEQSRLKARDKEITKRLLLVSTAFFILNMPLMVVTVAHNIMALQNNKEYQRGPWADAFHITLMFFYLNLAINFFLYCFTGKIFRRAAFALFKCDIREMKRQRSLLDYPTTSSGQTDRTDISRRSSDISMNKVNKEILIQRDLPISSVAPHREERVLTTISERQANGSDIA